MINCVHLHRRRESSSPTKIPTFVDPPPKKRNTSYDDFKQKKNVNPFFWGGTKELRVFYEVFRANPLRAISLMRNQLLCICPKCIIMRHIKIPPLRVTRNYQAFIIYSPKYHDTLNRPNPKATSVTPTSPKTDDKYSRGKRYRHEVL